MGSVPLSAGRSEEPSRHTRADVTSARAANDQRAHTNVRVSPQCVALPVPTIWAMRHVHDLRGVVADALTMRSRELIGVPQLRAPSLRARGPMVVGLTAYTHTHTHMPYAAVPGCLGVSIRMSPPSAALCRTIPTSSHQMKGWERYARAVLFRLKATTGGWLGGGLGSECLSAARGEGARPTCSEIAKAKQARLDLHRAASRAPGADRQLPGTSAIYQASHGWSCWAGPGGAPVYLHVSYICT